MDVRNRFALPSFRKPFKEITGVIYRMNISSRFCLIKIKLKLNYSVSNCEVLAYFIAVASDFLV